MNWKTFMNNVTHSLVSDLLHFEGSEDCVHVFERQWYESTFRLLIEALITATYTH